MMEVQSEFVEPVTPALSCNNASFWRVEDSGYHTSSFTPGSVLASELSNENLDPAVLHGQIRISGQFHVNYDVTPESNFRSGRRFVRGKNILGNTQNESTPESPISRRAVKRPYCDDTDDSTQTSVPTPTSAIAGGIQKLKVTDNRRSSQSCFLKSSASSQLSESESIDLYQISEYSHNLSYPTTPIKKICRTSCKLSPMKRSNKKLNFAIHSLSCESHGVVKNLPLPKIVKSIQFRPNQKIDMIKMLYQDAGVIPPVVKILSYLSYEDICSFKLVSSLWNKVSTLVPKTKKQEFKTFSKQEKDNQENKEKGDLRKNSYSNLHRVLKDNVMNTSATITSTPRSPPGTPRTNKFKKFTKYAQLDTRLQLSCVRCNQPSKVTTESTGEEWAQCTSVTCFYRFCKFCMCDRHPGKTCLIYDLNGPSPSKRRKNTNAACTRKSKKSLYRLMI